MKQLSGILGQILECRRRDLERQRRRVPLEEMRRRAETRSDFRPFADALRSCSRKSGCAIIAELKKASPSAGELCAEYAPAEIARSYAKAGACCLSVLTEQNFFQGAPQHLGAVRQAVELPVLRKDFLFDEYQVEESAALGADCILLIAAVFSGDPARMQTLAAQARQRGMDVLAEVHNARELEYALDTGASVLGVNNRDLHSFETRLQTTLDLLPQIPAELPVVSESGIHTAEDVRRLHSGGVHCFLVGEALMRAPDPGEALQALLAASGPLQ